MVNSTLFLSAAMATRVEEFGHAHQLTVSDVVLHAIDLAATKNLPVPSARVLGDKVERRIHLPEVARVLLDDYAVRHDSSLSAALHAFLVATADDWQSERALSWSTHDAAADGEDEGKYFIVDERSGEDVATIEATLVDRTFVGTATLHRPHLSGMMVLALFTEKVLRYFLMDSCRRDCDSIMLRDAATGESWTCAYPTSSDDDSEAVG